MIQMSLKDPNIILQWRLLKSIMQQIFESDTESLMSSEREGGQITKKAHSALNAVAEEVRPSEMLLAFLDDIYVVCAPNRVATIYALLQLHARIRLKLGKTHHQSSTCG